MTIRFGKAFCVKTGGASDDLHIKNSTFIDCASGVYHTFGQGDGYIFEENEFYHTSNIDMRQDANGPFVDDNGDISAIDSSTGVTNFIIRRNYIHDWKGEGIYMYLPDGGDYDGLEIYHNRIDMGYQATRWNTGILLSGANFADFADDFENAKVYGNVITNVGNGSDSTLASAIRTKIGTPTTAANKLKIYNNTISDCYIGIYGRNKASGEQEIGFDAKNNIIEDVKSGGYFVYIEDSDVTGIEMDYNDYEGTGQWKWDGGTDRSAIADWRTDSSQDDHAITDDCALLDSYALSSGSACINTGADLGSYDGLNPNSSWPDNVNTQPQDDWGDWEIGAFLYIISATTSGVSIGSSP
jgi:hypothetical protein